jgi:hypothetical protein
MLDRFPRGIYLNLKDKSRSYRCTESKSHCALAGRKCRGGFFFSDVD